MLRKFFLFVVVWFFSSTVVQAETLPLVTVEWLKENKNTCGVVILDIRNRIGGGSEESYRQGHIPGAVYSNYLTDGWRVKRDGIMGQLPAVEDLEELIGGLGISNDTHVIIVTDGVSSTDMGSATRVYWTFKVVGHDRVSILDGGYRAYTSDESNPIEEGWNTPRRRKFVGKFRPELVMDKQQVIEARQQGRTFIDVRPSSQHLGQTKHAAAPRSGTIPGAFSLPPENLTDEGSFKGPQTIGELLGRFEVNARDEVITFCNSGHWGSLGWFMISEVLRKPHVKLYDGSMIEWSSDLSLPVH